MAAVQFACQPPPQSDDSAEESSAEPARFELTATGSAAEMLLEIQRAVADRIVKPQEAMQIVAAAGSTPSLDSIRLAQRFVGALPPLQRSSDSLYADGWQSFGYPNQQLGRLVVRYAVGMDLPGFPAGAVPQVPAEGTRLTRAVLKTWMTDHGIVGVRPDILQYAFAVWHVTRENLARLAGLSEGARIEVGAFDYVSPKREGDEAQLVPILAKLGAQRLFNDRFRLGPALTLRPPISEGMKTVLFAAEAAEFAPTLGFAVQPSFESVYAANAVAAPPILAWAEALDPSSAMGVSLRMLSEILDLAESNGFFFIEHTYFKSSNYSDFIEPRVSIIASSRYKVTPAGIRKSLPRLIGTTYMINGGSGIDPWNFDDRVGIALEDESGMPFGRASLRVLHAPSLELALPFSRPRTRLRLPDGRYVWLEVGYTTATLPHEHWELEARDLLHRWGPGGPPPSPPGPTILDKAPARAPGTAPASLADALRLPAISAPAGAISIATYGGRKYTQLGKAQFLENEVCIVPPGIDFYDTVVVTSPTAVYWVAPQAWVDSTPRTSPDLESLRLESNFYATIRNARGLISFDLASRQWRRFSVPLPKLTSNQLTGGRQRVETHSDGDVLVITTRDWNSATGTYVDVDTTIDLRGITPQPVGQGYFTSVKPPYGNGTLY